MYISLKTIFSFVDLKVKYRNDDAMKLALQKGMKAELSGLKCLI